MDHILDVILLGEGDPDNIPSYYFILYLYFRES